jgi:hypothetical protein
MTHLSITTAPKELAGLMDKAVNLVKYATDFEEMLAVFYNHWFDGEFIQVFYEKDSQAFVVDIKIKEGEIITTPSDIETNSKPVTL